VIAEQVATAGAPASDLLEQVAATCWSHLLEQVTSDMTVVTGQCAASAVAW